MTAYWIVVGQFIHCDLNPIVLLDHEVFIVLGNSGRKNALDSWLHAETNLSWFQIFQMKFPFNYVWSKFQVITALGKIWHLEHFCCQSCREELGTRSFFERDEMPYCEPCYHQLFAPTCEKCQEPILDVGSSYKLGPLVLFCEFIWMLKIAYLCQPFFYKQQIV